MLARTEELRALVEAGKASEAGPGWLEILCEEVPPPPPPPPPPADGAFRPVTTSTLGGGASAVADGVGLEGARYEAGRWVLVDGASSRGKGGAVLALVALGLLVAGSSKRGRRA